MAVQAKRIEAEEYLAELDAEAEEASIAMQSQQMLTHTATQAARVERDHIIAALHDTPRGSSVEEAIMIIRDLPPIRFNIE